VSWAANATTTVSPARYRELAARVKLLPWLSWGVAGDQHVGRACRRAALLVPAAAMVVAGVALLRPG
jgi:hypothetical protein